MVMTNIIRDVWTVYVNTVTLLLTPGQLWNSRNILPDHSIYKAIPVIS